MTSSTWFSWLNTYAAMPAEETTSIDSHNIWHHIFSKHSYASLSPEAHQEITQVLQAFYSGCQLIQVASDPILENVDVLSNLNQQPGLVCWVEPASDKESEKKHFYYAEFNASKKKYVLQPIKLYEKGKTKEDTEILVSKELYANFESIEFPLVNQPSRKATPTELKYIRATTDCMRFKKPAVLEIFKKRKFRREALKNSHALLDSLTPDAFQFYNAHQVQHLDEVLQFALYQYLAHAQAATDHIGVIRSQHTELASCYKRIKQCTLYRNQLKLRQIALDLQVLKHAQAENEKADNTQVDTLKTRYQELDLNVQQSSYEICNVLEQYQSALENTCSKYDQIECLHEKMNLTRRELKQAEKEAAQLGVRLSIENFLRGLAGYNNANQDHLNSLKARVNGLCIQYDQDKEKLDRLKNDLDGMYTSVESLKPAPLKSFIPFLKEDEDDLDSDYILAQLGKANMRRLFWVWTRCVVEMLVIAAHEMILVSTMIAAWVSWSLYWFRGGQDAIKAAMHSWDALVSERERVISARKRMLAQLEERYDSIANDLIWGSSNFAGCFFLIGTLSVIGDILTTILLGMDLFLAGLRWMNGKAAHREMMQSYDTQLNEMLNEMIDHISKGKSFNTQALKNSVQALQALKDKYKALYTLQSAEYIWTPWKRYKHDADIQEAYKAVQEALSEVEALSKIDQDPFDSLGLHWDSLFLHWKSLLADQQQCSQQWKNTLSMLIYDLAYAIALIVGFILMCFAPPVGVSLLGALILVAGTIAWRTFYAADDIFNTTHAIDLAEEEFLIAVEQFMCDLGKEGHQDQIPQDQMKQASLYIWTLGAQLVFEQESKRFKQVDYGRDSWMRFMVPTAIILTLLFAPAMTASIPTYVFLLLGILVFALVTSAAIHHWVKPQASMWQKEIKLETDKVKDKVTVSVPTVCYSEEEIKSDKNMITISVPTACYKEEDYQAFKKFLSKEDKVDKRQENNETQPLIHPKDQKDERKRTALELLGIMKTCRTGTTTMSIEFSKLSSRPT